MFEGLADTIDGLVVPVDAAGVRELVQLSDRLALKVRTALGMLDATRGYEADGHVDLRPWLEQECGLDPRTASREGVASRKLHALPNLEAMAADGSLSSGQVEAVLLGIGRHRAAFAATGDELLARLVGLSVRDTVLAVADWAEEQDNAEPLPPTDTPHSTYVGARYLDGREAGRVDLAPDDAQVLRAALAAADSHDDDLTLAERQGEALVTIARQFLGHQHCARPGRSATHSTSG